MISTRYFYRREQTKKDSLEKRRIFADSIRRTDGHHNLVRALRPAHDVPPQTRTEQWMYKRIFPQGQERVQHRASAGDEDELVAGGSWHILSKISPFCQWLFLKPHNTRVTAKSSFLGSQHSIAELASRIRAWISYGLCDLLQSLRAYIVADVDPLCMLRYRMARSAGD